MLTQEEDQQLVERVQRGDKRAFDLLVLKYQHKILGLIVRFVHDTHEAQDGKRDIEKLYLKAVNNATQFIYIENQYFRWPPLAEAINKAAADQTRAGRDPGLHGNLHLFVITNASEDGVGPGALNTSSGRNGSSIEQNT